MSKVFERRPYQERIISKADVNWRCGVRSQIVVSPTGSGKSYVGLNILKNVVVNSRDILGCESGEVGVVWMAMRRNLLRQVEVENVGVGCPNVHFISMFDKDPLVGLEGYRKLVLCTDEAHHDSTDSGVAIHNALRPVFCLGLSATPVRTDRVKLCYEVTLQDAGYHFLIQDGYLSGFDQFMLGEFSPKSVCREYLRDVGRWGKSLMFFLTFGECLECAGLLRGAGVRCEVVTGDSDRDCQLDAFERGEVDVLVNMFVLTEGFDCCDLRTVWVRDSCNRGPVTQMAGRVLRKHVSKPFANIVQSVNSGFPFSRVAKPHAQFVLRDGEWCSVGSNELVRVMSRNMVQRVVRSEVNYKCLEFLKNNGGKRFIDDFEE